MSKPRSYLFRGTRGYVEFESNSEASKKSVNHANKSAPVKSVPATEVRFSQTSVNDTEDIILSMREHGWQGEPIDVVIMGDGKMTTIDNTRLAAAQIAGIEARVRIHYRSDKLNDAYLAMRFSTGKDGIPETWGQAIDYRIKKQNHGFAKDYPNGSYNIRDIR